MVTVAAGTDVYGAVRKVDATPIVTKFAMLQFFPLYPVESFYLARMGARKASGIPLIASQSSQAITGLRLARVDRLSVCVTYLRAAGAVLAIFGFIILLGGFVASFNGQKLDEFARAMMAVTALMLVGGLLISLPTYYFTFTVPERDKQIRQACGQLLGIAADPAHVDADTAGTLLKSINAALAQSKIANPGNLIHNPAKVNPDIAALLLLWTRTQIATGGDQDLLEQATDSLIRTLPTPAEVL